MKYLLVNFAKRDVKVFDTEKEALTVQALPPPYNPGDPPSDEYPTLCEAGPWQKIWALKVCGGDYVDYPKGTWVLSANELGPWTKVLDLFQVWPDWTSHGFRVFLGWKNGSYISSWQEAFHNELNELIQKFGKPDTIELRNTDDPTSFAPPVL